MSEHVFSEVRMARTINGWQVWVEGTQHCLAMVQSEREAKSIVTKLKSLGAKLDWSNRMRGFASAT